jgi:hypothetical protein
VSPARSLSASRERCAFRADIRGDQMLGTAFPAARLLLVEEPFPWGTEGLRTSRFDRVAALALEARCREEGVRVQAVRPLRRDAEDARERLRWALVDTTAGREALWMGDYGEDDELLELPLDGSIGEPAREPYYLVCTHGKHDPCCALRGRPVASALAHVRPGRVWQSAHLGGCRFAPTVLVLPLGVMYGRVSPTTAPEFIAAAEAGEVIGTNLRGRIGMPAAAQAALGYAHQHLGLARLVDVAHVSSTAVDAATVRVRVNTPRGLFDVTVGRERVDAAGLTCARPGLSWFLAHHPRAIEPVAEF